MKTLVILASLTLILTGSIPVGIVLFFFTEQGGDTIDLDQFDNQQTVSVIPIDEPIFNDQDSDECRELVLQYYERAKNTYNEKLDA